jgi:hypothetical protein
MDCMIPAPAKVVLFLHFSSARKFVARPTTVTKLTAFNKVLVSISRAAECLLSGRTVSRAIAVKQQSELTVVALAMTSSSSAARLSTAPKTVSGSSIARAAQMLVAIAAI